MSVGKDSKPVVYVTLYKPGWLALVLNRVEWTREASEVEKLEELVASIPLNRTAQYSATGGILFNDADDALIWLCQQ